MRRYFPSISTEYNQGCRFRNSLRGANIFWPPPSTFSHRFLATFKSIFKIFRYFWKFSCFFGDFLLIFLPFNRPNRCPWVRFTVPNDQYIAISIQLFAMFLLCSQCLCCSIYVFMIRQHVCISNKSLNCNLSPTIYRYCVPNYQHPCLPSR